VWCSIAPPAVRLPNPTGEMTQGGTRTLVLVSHHFMVASLCDLRQ